MVNPYGGCMNIRKLFKALFGQQMTDVQSSCETCSDLCPYVI